MKPIHYNIRITPNFSDFSFEGVVTLEIQAGESVSKVVLDTRELDIQSCALSQNDNQRECTFALLEDQRVLEINLPEAVLSTFNLTIDYTGIINDQYAGLFRSKYLHDGQEKFMASTQFEASDARRAFPCFDRPNLKATFDIEYVINQDLTGISNTALLEEKNLDNGKKLVRFERTPKMSTYLVFFGMGEFEFLEDNSITPLVRVATSPGKTEFGHYALDMARKSLQFGEEYLKVPYPLSKCDYIAMPDSMGAMENFGAIRHAEDVLLVYPGITSKSRKALITKIIAHEGIHMWFGDLVSPAAWKYLWLNEAFATYFTYVIPHHFYPEWGVWEQFFHERLLSGMERDSLASTIPIDLPNVDDPNADPAPTPSTAPIVYNKGAAVIRMLAAYLGEDAFQQALHDFLVKYQFEAASSDEFWAAVETSSGVPLQDFAKTWIHQPGHPLITVEKVDRVLSLSQRRFCYGETVTAQTWVIPVDIVFFLSNGCTQTDQIILDQSNLTVNLPKETLAYKLNAGFTGFYRVNYPKENWEELGKLIMTQELPAIDSLNVIDDSFAFVKSGLLSVGAYLTFIGNYCSSEDRYLPLTNLARNLIRLVQANPQRRQEISALGLPIFEPALAQMGWTPQDEEPLVITELRETLLWAAFMLGSSKVADFAYPEYQHYLKGNPIHKDTIGTVTKIGAAIHPDACEQLWSIAIDPEQTEAERIMALEALGNHADQTQLLELLEKNLTEIPNSLQSYLIHACAQSLNGPNFLWDWFRDNLPQLETRPLPVVERLIVGITPFSGLGRTAEVAQVLDGFVARHPNAAHSVKMAVELLAVNEKIYKSNHEKG